MQERYIIIKLEKLRGYCFIELTPPLVEEDSLNMAVFVRIVANHTKGLNYNFMVSLKEFFVQLKGQFS